MSVFNSNLTHSDIDSETSRDPSDNFINISSDSSTYERSTYSNDSCSNVRLNRPLIWSSTKEEKQKHNEEIAVMEANSFEASSSWEKIDIADIQKEELEACRNFLINEQSFNSHDSNVSRPTTSAKPCFIDASSLLDDDYTPVVPQRNNQMDSAMDNRHMSPSYLSLTDDSTNRRASYEISDQFSAVQHLPPRQFKPSNCRDNSEYEKQQGRLIFQNSPHLQRRLMHNEDYPSDNSCEPLSLSSVHNNSIHDVPNYSHIHSEAESMSFPETPFNSIVHLTRKLEICEVDNSEFDENSQQQVNANRNISSPVQIPKRLIKHDESAPILSGGASITDFPPTKHPESPAVRRKTDSCPIVSGGSIDIEDTEPIPMTQNKNDKEKSSFSWFADLKITESPNNEREHATEVEESLASSSRNSNCSTPKNSLGFYVDFNSLEPLPEMTTTATATKKKDDLRKQSLKKSTGFFVDLSSADVSCPNTPKSSSEENTTGKRRQSESSDKSSIFNMFVDLENVDTNSHNSSKSESTDTQSKDNIQNIQEEATTSSTEISATNNNKKGCFMFIENDSHVVKHRKILPKEPSKRHSWNVQTNDLEEIKTNTKVYQRSTSVTSNDDKFIPSSLPAVYSKTSSMSIGSSISPHEDFSCSKSLSSRSNLTISTSNTSIENSETKVQCNDMEKNILRKRRKEAKINETYDKSSLGSVTDEIFSNEDNRTSSDTDEDLTFQNPKENEENNFDEEPKRHESILLDDIKSKMDTIVETSENSSPFKKPPAATKSDEKPSDDTVKNASSDVMKMDAPLYTMESLQQLIEKQKQILENVVEPTIVSPPSSPFVKLSDLDKPPVKKEYSSMTSSTAFRTTTSFENHQKHQNSLSRSTGNNMINLASSVENSKSLSRLFPHLSKVFSSSVPSNVGFNANSMDQSLYEYIEFISSDFSCTSSINSSRSGMDSADESSISCRQPRRLGEDLLRMFLQEIGTDVIIDVEGRKINAHKIILSSRCQYFAAMLAGKSMENSRNVISLTGYSYNTVHFALCHVYSGAAHVPSGLDLMELASLSDCLGLEGLKEVTGYALKTNYCHNFHKPCSGCIDGIVQVLSITLDHGFDDLYRKCIKQFCKYFCKVWVTRSFANLSFDLKLRCSQQIIAHFTSENVLNWILDCEDVLSILSSSRWESIETQNVVEVILDSAHEYIADHFSSLIASDSFLSLGHDRKDDIVKLEHAILKAATSLSPDQACKSYPRSVRLNTLLNAKLVKFPSPLSNDSFKPFDHIQLRDDEDIEWNDEFIKLVSALLSAVEQSLIRQCGKAMKCSAWLRMDADLRSKIQKIACVTDSEDIVRRNIRSSVTSIGSTSSSTTNRANDLRQVKLAIQAHKILTENNVYATNANVAAKKQQKDVKPANVTKNVKTKLHVIRDFSSTTVNIQKQKTVEEHKSQQNNGTEIKHKFNLVKARYMEPRKPRITLSEVPAKNIGLKKLSSSENSRESSPLFRRKKYAENMMRKASNLSLDSLQSPAKQKVVEDKGIPKKDSEVSMDSLSESLKSTSKASKLSNESLLKRTSLNEKDGLRNSARLRTSAKQTANSQNQVVQQRSFLSQKSREILAKKSQQSTRKLSTNSNSSIATKSTKSSSPRMVPISKSHSTNAVITGKKVFNTTLHLRKTSKLPELVDTKLAKGKTQKKELSTKLLNEKEKEIDKKAAVKTKKTIIEDLGHDNDIPLDTLTIEESFEVNNKMARSNTFSKEAPDNPIELLKTMK